MCGIGGYVLKAPAPLRARAIEALLSPLRSRGPDDEGVCLIDRCLGGTRHLSTRRTTAAVRAALPHIDGDASDCIHDAALLHTRFAVVDTEPDAHQPFVSRNGAITAAFHGEIHNHLELRSELERRGIALRTSSDTEVLVEGYALWGDALWGQLNGFWAVALFDRRTRDLVLCRDRFGIAPLYHVRTPEGHFFSSRIGPLADVSGGLCSIDRDLVAGFITTGLKDFGPETFCFPVRACAAGTILRFRADGGARHRPTERRYWTLPDRRLSPAELPFDEAARALRELLLDSVAIRLRADIPIACELSGGLDSASVVAAAAVHRPGIPTYTLRVPGQDEEPYARAILDRHAVTYNVVEVRAEELLTDGDAFARHMEEPFQSPNLYAHHLLRRHMKDEGVGVALCGSGGDEALAGYESEFWPAARAELLTAGRRFDVLRYDLARATRNATHAREAAWRALKWGKRRLIGATLPRSAREPARHNTPASLEGGYERLDFHQRSLYHFQVGMLPYYLASDDHMTMALPVEQRTPFLDHRIVELGLRLPPAYLFHRGWTKYLLRKAMEPLLPTRITWRRSKMGFPFALRPFLAGERRALEPLVRIAAECGVVGTLAPAEFGELLRRDPQRLWRICSTGMWIRSGAPPHGTVGRVAARPPLFG